MSKAKYQDQDMALICAANGAVQERIRAREEAQRRREAEERARKRMEETDRRQKAAAERRVERVRVLVDAGGFCSLGAVVMAAMWRGLITAELATPLATACFTLAMIRLDRHFRR